MFPDKHFLLADAKPEAPEHWRRRNVGSRHLAHAPDLPAHECALFGREGLLLGWPIGAKPDLGGRWVHIGKGTVTLDPLGSYAVVYHESGVVASSPAVMPSAILEEDGALNEALGLPAQDNWYPFGLTPHRNVRRLLPNHVLELHSLAARRAGPDVPAATPDVEAAGVIARNLKEQLATIAEAHPVVMGLTAGSDTRMLLAALRGRQARAAMFTVPHDVTDVHTARALAGRFGFPFHVEKPRRVPGRERAWFERAGRCVAGNTMKNAPIKQALGGDDLVRISGHGGEVGRAFYYRQGDRPGTQLGPQSILARLGFPITPRLARAAAGWLNGVPARADTYDMLGLLYLENRVGCWAAPILHGDTYWTAALWPLNQPSTVRAMLSLSDEAKKADRLGRMVTERLWPALLSLPINGAFSMRQAVRWGREQPLSVASIFLGKGAKWARRQARRLRSGLRRL